MDRMLGNYGPSTALNTHFSPRIQNFLMQRRYDHFSSADSTYAAMPQTESPRQEGPPFRETQVIHRPLNGNGNSLRPEIVANIQKGFFQVDGKWTCYRRNYFSVNCSFTLSPSGSAEGQLYLKQGEDMHAEPIQHFAMLISAKTSAANSQDSEARDLVQHTPKRSKDTESIPVRQILVPSNPPQHAQHPAGLPPFGAARYPGSHVHSSFGFPNYGEAPPASAPSSHTFDRIQFAKATANNGKRRAQQQYFHVVVELWACINRKHGEEWVLVATQDSDQVVIDYLDLVLKNLPEPIISDPPTHVCSSKHSHFTPPVLEAAEEDFFGIGRALSTRKRPLEDDGTEDESAFEGMYPFSESTSPDAFKIPPMMRK
ncbi:hypothetical protein DV738_g2106, partial [Chaetothyriales sp. CBS 135597]